MMKLSDEGISKETIDDLGATPLVVIAKRIAQLEEENAELKQEIEFLKKEAEPFRAQIDRRKTYKAYDEPDTRPTPLPPDDDVKSS